MHCSRLGALGDREWGMRWTFRGREKGKFDVIRSSHYSTCTGDSRADVRICSKRTCRCQADGVTFGALALSTTSCASCAPVQVDHLQILRVCSEDEILTRYLLDDVETLIAQGYVPSERIRNDFRALEKKSTGTTARPGCRLEGWKDEYERCIYKWIDARFT